MHRTYAEFGKCLAGGWGYEDDGDFSKRLKTLPQDARMVCLLAAVVHELQDIRGSFPVNTQRQLSEPSVDEQPVADGYLTVLMFSIGDAEIPSFDQNLDLPLRLRNILVRGHEQGINFMSQITTENLKKIRGCGKTTIRELLEWRDKKSNVELKDD